MTAAEAQTIVDSPYKGGNCILKNEGTFSHWFINSINPFGNRTQYYFKETEPKELNGNSSQATAEARFKSILETMEKL